MFSFLNNIPQVTKNILLLNVMLFIVTALLQQNQIFLVPILGAHYINSPLFEPYQIVTHFFMHGGLFHIFINMYIMVILGSFLERLWGAKRFFFFYIAAALGAFALYNVIGFAEIMALKQKLVSLGYDIESINHSIKNGLDFRIDPQHKYLFDNYWLKVSTPMVGASGAIFGIMAAFAILFPNTVFYLYFAIPVKAKYLVGGYFLLELYLAFQNNANDPVAHLAHIGGAVVGGILVLVWRKTDKKNFW